MRPDLALVRRIWRHREPTPQDQQNDLRLWDIRTAITTGVAAAILGLAILTLIAWLLLHHPSLPHTKTISLHDSISVLQLVFASVAGAGALVGLIVAYRRQKVAEADSAHDRTRVYNERFTAIAAQLGDNKPAVRLAGVHAMAGLADDWKANRQTCIDVLCAYLRMPYEPKPADEASAQEKLAFQANQEVRHTAIRVITQHLQESAATPWFGRKLDFTGMMFDGGDFSNAVFSGDEVSFKNTSFSGGTVNFQDAVFSGRKVSFENASFSGGEVNFGGARFSDGLVSFLDAKFSDSEVSFLGAKFCGSAADFRRVMFSGGEVNFVVTEFSSGPINFGDATFSGSQVNFAGADFSGSKLDFYIARFSDGEVSFVGADFSGSKLDFAEVRDWSAPPIFDQQNPPGVRLPPS